MKYSQWLFFVLMGLWAAGCGNTPENQTSSSSGIPKPYQEIGSRYAMETKLVLGKNLMTAINTQGTEYALEFCNEKAYPLTDSMATALNAYIKRVSDKQRNPENKANAAELAYIQTAKAQLEKGENVTPMVNTTGQRVVTYYPIITNQMCLQCHGKPNEDILPATLNKLKTLYPGDMATGYGVDELRGIWVVEMDK